MTDIYGMPEADDFTFVLTAANGEKYDAFIEVSKITGFSSTELDIRTRKQGNPSAEWDFLHGMTFYESDIDTKQKTDELLDEFISQANEAIKKVFGSASVEAPESGVERLEWVIKNKLQVNDNVISKK